LAKRAAATLNKSDEKLVLQKHRSGFSSYVLALMLSFHNRNPPQILAIQTKVEPKLQSRGHHHKPLAKTENLLMTLKCRPNIE